MSWSINFIGKPEKVSDAITAQSANFNGETKAEYDSAVPSLIGLVNENFGNDYAIKLAASGHGNAGDKPDRVLTVSLDVIYGLLV